jgi:hypothetical protein
MKHTFTHPSRAEILAVACPTCGAVPGEACRRADGKSHEPRLGVARAALSRQRSALRDTAAKRVARDFLRP